MISLSWILLWMRVHWIHLAVILEEQVEKGFLHPVIDLMLKLVHQLLTWMWIKSTRFKKWNTHSFFVETKISLLPIWFVCCQSGLQGPGSTSCEWKNKVFFDGG